jgi:hypothetical protein
MPAAMIPVKLQRIAHNDFLTTLAGGKSQFDL